MDACPVNAIHRDFRTSALLVNHDICIGCKECMIACPCGAIGFDSVKQLMFKCDLCHGDPQCVKWCPRDALRYDTAEITHLLRQQTIMEERVAKPMIEAAKAQGAGQPLPSDYSQPSEKK